MGRRVLLPNVRFNALPSPIELTNSTQVRSWCWEPHCVPRVERTLRRLHSKRIMATASVVTRRPESTSLARHGRRNVVGPNHVRLQRPTARLAGTSDPRGRSSVYQHILHEHGSRLPHTFGFDPSLESRSGSRAATQSHMAKQHRILVARSPHLICITSQERQTRSPVSEDLEDIQIANWGRSVLRQHLGGPNE
jgi:hypothetical protein